MEVLVPNSDDSTITQLLLLFEMPRILLNATSKDRLLLSFPSVFSPHPFLSVWKSKLLAGTIGCNRQKKALG